MTITHTRRVETLDRILRDLGESADLGRSVREPKVLPPIECPLPVAALAQDSVDAAALAAALLVGSERRCVPAVGSSGPRVAAAYSSERLFSIDGTTPSAWAELSGFWPTRRGWLRTHGNYPHHAARLRSALGLAPHTGADELRTALTRISADDAAVRIVARGGIASVVAEVDSLEDQHLEASALVDRVSSAAAARPLLAQTPPVAASPLSGVRVLDLTRVIAGPVATRTLALFGADVLRIDSPRLPEIPWQHLDSGAGKRSALLDLADGHDRMRFDELLGTADVIVLGYRPTALQRLGLDPERIVARHPGMIVARLSAWGFEGPDAERTGFDSIVQAASGISRTLSSEDGTPGALPVQALDHSAGYLLAAAICSVLRRRQVEGGSHVVSTSLRRVAAHLLSLPTGRRTPAADLAAESVTHASAAGLLHYVLPAPSFAGSPADFAHPPHPWGSDPAAWLPRD